MVRISIPSSSFAAIFSVSHVAGIYRKRADGARYLQSTLERSVSALRLQILVVGGDYLLLSLAFNTDHVALHLDIDSVLGDSRDVADNDELRIRLVYKYISSNSNFNDIDAHTITICCIILTNPKEDPQSRLFHSCSRNGRKSKIVVFKVRVGCIVQYGHVWDSRRIEKSDLERFESKKQGTLLQKDQKCACTASLYYFVHSDPSPSYFSHLLRDPYQ